VPAKIKDTDHGFKKLMGELGELGTITIGVQGQEALSMHPEANMTVGELAQRHELGLGVPQRSFIRAWFDKHEARLRKETAAELEAVLKGTSTRKKSLAALGYKWTEEIREHIDRNEVDGPPLAPATVAKKGHDTKLLGFTYTLRNAVTYKLFLPQKKSIRDVEQRKAARGQS